ncbi:extracellular solute-binding protein [Testudinibacter sp. TR-2022]|uniref:extracellular solute-binding protein n=1 Tax=Testudinibacter sp. TR-2022 TaxID=2585029 RepID=UPI00111A244D|nr:extracellular solute-binding protein [Testudinibacter sp. TR-2022]TNH01587.1 extracellular solute-binding protein [Pasteurellaceae bacterium Phil31]TNH07444.1 extracellular solute-binding protein [Testudinibacter sp. TR-2022]TNH09278.1 extracellular solute-binding protein [Testudinibacter sp. TR-2022]TNH12998.1 extracellular solute-binding protein [Testudinibacter sp. TR-2022]TNH14870.1 extracellular solute-binding protein [Testudinibacter sp. TR-2022]
MKYFKKISQIGLAVSTLALSALSHADALDGKSWAEIEALAKKEGEVVFSIWYLQPAWRSVVKDFEQQYGIKVRIPEGTLDGNTNKLIAEKNLAPGKMDVIAVSAEGITTLNNFDVTKPLTSLPNFEKLNHHLQGVNLGDNAIGYWGNQTGLAYDPMRLKQEDLPQTWQQLESYIKNNPKKFGYSDPNGGGSGNAFIQRALVYVSGDYDYRQETVDPEQVKKWESTWKWFQDNHANMTRTSSNADSLTRLNDGELNLVAAWQDHLFSLQKQGAVTKRLAFYVPEFGMLGGGNAVVVAKNSPHPAASMLFVHWVTSPETQQKLKDNFGVRPLSSDSGEKDIVGFAAPWAKMQVQAFTKDVVSR